METVHKKKLQEQREWRYFRGVLERFHCISNRFRECQEFPGDSREFRDFEQRASRGVSERLQDDLAGFHGSY